MHYCLFWKTIKKTDFYFEELLPFCPFGAAGAVTVIAAVTSAFAFVALNVKTVSPAETAVIVATPLSIATVAVAGVPETTFNPSSSEAFDTVIVPVLPASIESVALSRVITFLYRVPKFCK
jgi:hypothetical protein